MPTDQAAQGQGDPTLYRIRILHISDIHFRSPDGDIPEWRREQVLREQWRREHVLGEKWEANLGDITADGVPFDLVCLTGDIADWGLSEEYKRATGFLKNLMDTLNLPMQRLFLVPGNHDIHRPTEKAAWESIREAAAATSKPTFSNWIAGGAAPHGISDETREAVLLRTSAWRTWVADHLGCAHCASGTNSHPRLGFHQEITLPNRPFALHMIGLDSGWLAGDEHDQGKLQITEDQIWRNATNDGKPLEGLRVALVHHPLGECADGTRAWKLLSEHADLLLRGHQHDPLAEIRRDPDRGLVVLAAGSLYEGSEGHNYPNGMQVIDITADDAGRPLAYDVRFRSWSPNGFWHDDSSLYRQATNGRLRIQVSDQNPS